METMRVMQEGAPLDKVRRMLDGQHAAVSLVAENLSDATALALTMQDAATAGIQRKLKASVTRANNSTGKAIVPVRDKLETAVRSATTEQMVQLNPVAVRSGIDPKTCKKTPPHVKGQVGCGDFYDPSTLVRYDAQNNPVYVGGHYELHGGDIVLDVTGAIFDDCCNWTCPPGFGPGNVVVENVGCVACVRPRSQPEPEPEPEPPPPLPPPGVPPPVVVPPLPPPDTPGPVCPTEVCAPNDPCAGVRTPRAELYQAARLEGTAGPDAWVGSDCADRQIEAVAGSQYPVSAILDKMKIDPSGMSLFPGKQGLSFDDWVQSLTPDQGQVSLWRTGGLARTT